jgi:hypothetical protein
MTAQSQTGTPNQVDAALGIASTGFPYSPLTRSTKSR